MSHSHPASPHTGHDHGHADHHDDHSHDHDHGHDHGHGEHHDHDHGHGFLGRLRHALTPHSHDHTEAILTAEEASAHGIRAAWISLAGMGATAVLQIVIVALSGSMALLADTLHNLGHLATTIPLILAFRIGRRPRTRRYPYGFKRAEDLVGLLIGFVIALSAALIIWESVRAIAQPRALTNLGWVLAAAIIGAAGNEIVAQYRIRAGRRIGSAALIAEGQHARTDALTSLAVIIGVAGAWLGLPQLDAIVGLVIAAVIVLVLVQSMRTVVRRLMDGVEDGTLESIEAAAGSVAGVMAVDDVRARWLGHRIEGEVTITVPRDSSQDSIGATIDEVRAAMRVALPQLDRAVVQVRPG